MIDKPLRDCTVEDLIGLTESELHKLLLKNSRFSDRTVHEYEYIKDENHGINWYLSFGEDDSRRARDEPVQFEISYEEPDANKNETIRIHVPSTRVDYDAFFMQLNNKLDELNLPNLSPYYPGQRLWDESRMFRFKHIDPFQIFDYGDGRIKGSTERLEQLLHKEVQDLHALGLDFKDIIEALENAIDLKGELGYITGEHIEGSAGGTWTYKSSTKPNIDLHARIWKFCVICLPFPDIQKSVVDFTYYDSQYPETITAISETSLDLYRNRIIEGHYLPHYRISAARTVGD